MFDIYAFIWEILDVINGNDFPFDVSPAGRKDRFVEVSLIMMDIGNFSITEIMGDTFALKPIDMNLDPVIIQFLA